MKKGFSFGLTLITLLVFALLYTYLLGKIFNAFESPHFVVVVLMLVFYASVFGILVWMRPEPFQPVRDYFKSLSTKDRIVLLFSYSMPILFISFLGDYVRSLPISMQLIYIGIVLLLAVAPIMLFGSKDLRKKPIRNQKD